METKDMKWLSKSIYLGKKKWAYRDTRKITFVEDRERGTVQMDVYLREIKKVMEAK